MAKKIKRKVSQVNTSAPVAEVYDTPRPVSESPVSAAPRTFSRKAVTSVEFNPDYTYVVRDLKRIGILAGSFFVLLIALSFIMPLIMK